MRTRLVGLLLALGMLLALVPSASAAPPTPALPTPGPATVAEVQEPITITDPTGRITFKLTVVEEQQTGQFGGSGTRICPVTPENGFTGPTVDTGPLDGIVCADQMVGYNISYTVAPSSTPTVLSLSIPMSRWDQDGTLVPGGTIHDIARLIAGGTGFAHTGSGSTMTFPASQESQTINAGTYYGEVGSRDWNAGVYAGMWVSPYFRMVSGNKVYESDYLSRPTYLTGVTMITPRLSQSSLVFTVDPDGSQWWDATYSLRHYVAPLVGSNSPVVRADVHTVVDLSMLPAGTVLSTNESSLTFDGAPRFYIDGTSAVLDGVASFRHEEMVTYPPNLTSWPLTIKARIPVGSLPAGLNEFFPRITEFNADAVGWRPTQQLPFGTDMYPDHQILGFTESPNFDTTQRLPDGRVIQPLGRSVKNDTVARTLIPTTQSGVYSKWLWANDNGAVGGRIYDHNDIALWHPSATWWTEMNVASFYGNLVNTTYMDAFDAKYQQLDPSRDIVVTKFEGGQMVPAPEAVIQFATLPNITSIVPNGGNTLSAAQIAGTIQWYDEYRPGETNVIKVQFPGTMSGGASAGMWPHRILLPMMATDVANFADTSYPLKISLRDTMAVVNNNSNGGAVSRWMNIKGGSFDYAAGGRTVNMNAGTTGRDGHIWMRTTLDTPDVTTMPVQPESITITIPSALSSVVWPAQFWNNKQWTVVGFEPADWGPDGLPGTLDDVSDWKWTIEVNDGVMAQTGLLKYLDFDLPTVTVPGYIADGTVLKGSISVTASGNERFPESTLVNNKSDIIYNIRSNALVSQSKWALKTDELVGTDIGWGVAWASNSIGAVGPVTVYDILPHNGDGRGTKLAAPLSNIRFIMKNADTDVSIWVTDADPTTLTPALMKTIPMVPLVEADTLAGDITAYKLIEQSVDPKDIHSIEVVASTTGTVDNDLAVNALLEGSVTGMMAMPPTNNVTTVLYDSSIAGTLWFDSDQDGSLDTNEPRRFDNIVVTLRDESGAVVESVPSNPDGTYRFTTLPTGNYTITTEMVTEYTRTTLDVRSASITILNKYITNQDFGFYRETAEPVLTKTWNAATGKFTLTVTNPSSTLPVFGRALTDQMYNTINQPMAPLTIINASGGTATGNQWTIPDMLPGESLTAEVNFDAGALVDGIHVTNRFGEGVCTDSTYDASETSAQCAEARVDGVSSAPGAPTPSIRTSTGR